MLDPIKTEVDSLADEVYEDVKQISLIIFYHQRMKLLINMSLISKRLQVDVVSVDVVSPLSTKK